MNLCKILTEISNICEHAFQHTIDGDAVLAHEWSYLSSSALCHSCMMVPSYCFVTIGIIEADRTHSPWFCSSTELTLLFQRQHQVNRENIGLELTQSFFFFFFMSGPGTLVVCLMFRGNVHGSVTNNKLHICKACWNFLVLVTLLYWNMKQERWSTTLSLSNVRATLDVAELWPRGSSRMQRSTHGVSYRTERLLPGFQTVTA